MLKAQLLLQRNYWKFRLFNLFITLAQIDLQLPYIVVFNLGLTFKKHNRRIIQRSMNKQAYFIKPYIRQWIIILLNLSNKLHVQFCFCLLLQTLHVELNLETGTIKIMQPTFSSESRSPKTGLFSVKRPSSQALAEFYKKTLTA